VLTTRETTKKRSASKSFQNWGPGEKGTRGKSFCRLNPNVRRQKRGATDLYQLAKRIHPERGHDEALARLKGGVKEAGIGGSALSSS